MALTLVMKHCLRMSFQAAVAMEGTVHLALDLANIVLKPEKVLELLVVTNHEPLNVALGLVRRDALVSSLATRLEYSRQIRTQIASISLEHCHGRAIDVRAQHLRQFQLPDCSSLAKGCASSLVWRYYS